MFLAIKFQSTLPYGSDQQLSTTFYNFYISIHAPLRERRLILDKLFIKHRFQSTLPYGSDSSKVTLSINLILISIHAPNGSRYIDHKISIHAPLRERPPRYPLCRILRRDFNPRSLTGATSR